MRLIDADAFLEDMERCWHWESVNGITTATALRQVMSDIRNAPTIEPDRPHGEWIPITYRPMDEEEYEEFRREFGELPVKDRKMFSCPMPDDDQEILVCTSWGGVSQDRCELDEMGYALETNGDWDGIIAWMPLPEPYKKEGEEK